MNLNYLSKFKVNYVPMNFLISKRNAILSLPIIYNMYNKYIHTFAKSKYGTYMILF